MGFIEFLQMRTGLKITKLQHFLDVFTDEEILIEIDEYANRKN